MSGEALRLGDLLHLTRGVSWDASQQRAQAGLGTWPVLRIPNIKDTLVLDDLIHVRVSASVARQALATRGSIVMVGSNGNPRRVGNAVFISQDEGFLFASFLMAARVKNELAAYPKLLYHFIASPSVQDIITRSVQGSTGLKNLSARTIQDLRLPAFSLPEQRRIAEILDTLDEAIRKTEQVIAKLQQMKQGLLHDLLTRGIDENGELRDPERHPEQFKDSPLGRIPRGWEVQPLGSCGRWVSGGTPSTSEARFWGGGIPWITASSLKSFWLSRSKRTLTKRGVASGSRMVPAGTSLFVVRGMSLKSEFRVGVADRELAFGQDCKAIVPAPHVEPVFLGLLLHGSADRVLRLVDEASHGTGRLAIPPLQALWVAVPEPKEQRAVVARMQTADVRLRGEQQALAKLRTLKHGLMDDLLTGGVRVAVPEEVPR